RNTASVLNRWLSEPLQIIQEEYLATCKTLGIEPYRPHEVYDKLPVREVIERAAAARQRMEEIREGLRSGTLDLTKSDKHRRLRPGRKARTDEEYAQYALELIEEWQRWKRTGQSQQDFADFKGWQSRTPLTDALSW